MPSDVIVNGLIHHPDGELTDLIQVELDVPVMAFEQAGEVYERRFTGATARVAVGQPAGRSDFRTAFPGQIFGDSTDALNRYLWLRISDEDAAAFRIGIEASYRSRDGHWLGSETVDVLLLPIVPETRELPPPEARNTCFLVAKEHLDDLRRTSLADLPAIADAPLQSALAALAKWSEAGPVVDPSRIEDVRDRMAREIPTDQAALIVQRLALAFGDLTRLDLTVPSLDPLRIAGSLTLRTPDAGVVTGRDFATVEIAAEWSDGHDGRPHSVRFRFPADAAPVDATVPFSVAGDVPVPKVAIADPVTVRVHGLDGEVLWEQRYRPSDDALADLHITVPLRRPTTLTGPNTLPDDANLRLRGRVVVLGKTCSLRDVLVLVQARTTADGPWRVVGAATTDASGNFGMPYPYGRYVEARAVVSLAPSDPVDVPVTPPDGERTVSRDFLYLLVEDPYAANDDCAGGDDCSCSTADTPDRLPDYSDLIGSDAYSQDIGGACVNLSKPNRTISEFPYRAVVRTSDPEVGTYRLTRVEEGLQSIDVSQRAGLTSAAESLLSTETAALEQARQNATNTPNVGTTQVFAAMTQIHPHAAALAAAFAPNGPLATLDALGAAAVHVDSVTSIGRAAQARLTAGGFSVPAELGQVVGLAEALRPLVELAVDTVGSAVRFELLGETGTRRRAPIGLTNPVEWQLGRPDGDGPTTSFSQAVTVASGHILTYKAVFKADGYSLGDLVHSLPLAPGQKKEIVVFDASQSLVGAETQQVSQNERLAMGLVNERDITSSLAGSLTESLSGSSAARTSGVSAGFGTAAQASGSMGMFSGSGGAVLGVSGGSSKSSSSAEQDGSRGVAQFFGERLRQSILQNAEGYRQLNATVVSTVTQGQRYGVTSEVIANHNHCHSLTMMYFEVLRHYAIFQELSSVEECVFVPFLMARFSTENVAAWRDVLAPALLPLPAETYLQPFQQLGTQGRGHPLVKAFDAVQRLRTHYANVDFPAGSYDEERIRFVKGTVNLRVHLPRPRTRYDRILSLPVIRTTVTTDEIDVVATVKQAGIDAFAAGMTLGLSTLFTGPPGSNISYKEVQVLAKQQIFDAFMTMDANYASVPPAQCIRVTNFNPTSTTIFGMSIPLPGLDFFADANRDREQWRLYASLLGYTDVLAMLTYYFKGRLISEWDQIYADDIAPAIYTKIVDSLRLSEFAADFTSPVRYTGGDRLVPLTVAATTAKSRSALPAQLELSSGSPTVRALRDHVTVLAESVRLDYSTSHYSGVLYAGSPVDDLLDTVRLDIPENADERRNPRREDRYLAAALMEHLNANLEYYNKVLWSRLDPDRRFMLLDGFSIQVYAADGTPADMRSLASVVKNEVVTAAGNALVFPVAPGYRVSGAFVQADPDRDDSVPATILEHYQPLTPVQPYRVSVPTGGAFMEAVQGACNACEAIEPDRAQDWSRFTSDEPTPISPVTVPSPASIDWRANYKDFAAPIVNVQNAPAAPAPGAGLEGLSELLAASGAFRDVTGLDANQQNAIRTYLSNQENAKAFATMAKEMAMQNHNTRNSGQIMDSISAARDSGMISRDEAGKLVGGHLQQQVDGGSSQRTKEESDRQAATSPMTKATADAAGRDRNVTWERSSEGGRESVTISGTPNATVDVGWTNVPSVLQGPNNKNCWAAATAMMVGWKKQKTFTMEEAVAPAGLRYLQMYRDGTGLPLVDKDDYLLRQRMRAEPSASYPFERYVELLKKYGPLWVMIDAQEGAGVSLHARVLTRITQTTEGNAVLISHDPARGPFTQTFAEFIASLEEAVAAVRGAGPIPQIVHFIEEAEPKEGFEIRVFGIHEPIHESITLMSLREAGIHVPDAMKPGKDPATDEFLRGVLWNDDPAVLLFDDRTDTNWDFSMGGVASWYLAFTLAEKAMMNNVGNLTGRSHYFDLQFLHAMAETPGEMPGDTLARIMMWAEVMYRLSIGDGVAGNDTIAGIPVTSSVEFGGVTHTANLASYFTDVSLPRGSDTIAHLLTQSTAYTGLELEKRAIGSLLHLVQDSYARGHVRRVLLNPRDLVGSSAETFKPGTYGKFGDILNLHCYRGQDHDQHSHYDTPAEDIDPTDLTLFNSLLGARDAIDASRRLLGMWRKRVKWDSQAGPKKYLAEQVFVLSPDATPADGTV